MFISSEQLSEQIIVNEQDENSSVVFVVVVELNLLYGHIKEETFPIRSLKCNNTV